MSNTFGDIFRVTLFGESHGPAVGCVIDGCLPGLNIELESIKNELRRRSPQSQFFSTPRDEEDEFEILSGVSNGKTTGGAISCIIRNKKMKSNEYNELDELFRPSHADFTYYSKYGTEVSAGKLQASGRLFAPMVVAGVIAKKILENNGIEIFAYVQQIGPVKLEKPQFFINNKKIEESPVRCPDKKTTGEMLKYLKDIHATGDTAGGIISCIIKGCEPGLGDPVFDKLQAKLACALFSIPSVKGFEYGSGFSSASMKGSEHNDPFIIKRNKLQTLTNHSGGIQGGISNGNDIYFNLAFKPISSIKQKQTTISRNAESKEFTIKGRHDVCILPRAVPIVEALTAIVLTDSYLKNLLYAV